MTDYNGGEQGICPRPEFLTSLKFKVLVKIKNYPHRNKIRAIGQAISALVCVGGGYFFAAEKHQLPQALPMLHPALALHQPEDRAIPDR